MFDAEQAQEKRGEYHLHSQGKEGLDGIVILTIELAVKGPNETYDQKAHNQ